jgi:hypothetical protein
MIFLFKLCAAMAVILNLDQKQKNSYFVNYHPRNISAKLAFNGTMVSEKNNLSIFSFGLNNTSIYKNNVLYIYKLQDSETKIIVLC